MKKIMTLGAIFGWSALVVEFYIQVQHSLADGLSVTAAVIKFFSYFTILTNILVATAYTSLLLSPKSVLGRFFSRPSVQSALLPSIVMVGVVYEVLLRKTSNPMGVRFISDMFLHDINPVLYLVFWFRYVPKDSLLWKDPLVWLTYPLTYLFYILCRGALMGKYPYPFINVNKLGYGQVFINAAGLILFFILVGECLVGFSVCLNERQKQER